MITDARVLQSEFVPKDVVHRDAEINHLSSALQPITDGERGETAFLFGPSGTGKTCIAQYTTTKLRESVIDLNYQYVNCWEDHSRFKTLYRVLEGIGRTVDIHRQSTPKDVLLDRIRDYNGPPYVVILDEVDQLEDKSLLYDLYRIRNLTMILIANQEEELFSEIGNRLTSRLRPSARVHFDKYGTTELVEILRDRVRWGLQDDVIEPRQLKLIADASGGDARVAIGILRVAARNASHSGTSTISDGVIEDAVSEAKAEVTQKNIEKLTDDQRLLYDIITDHGETKPGNLYEEYQERASDPRSKRMVRNYLQKMCHYNLIEAEGQNRGRRYRVVS